MKHEMRPNLNSLLKNRALVGCVTGAESGSTGQSFAQEFNDRIPELNFAAQAMADIQAIMQQSLKRGDTDSAGSLLLDALITRLQPAVLVRSWIQQVPGKTPMDQPGDELKLEDQLGLRGGPGWEDTSPELKESIIENVRDCLQSATPQRHAISTSVYICTVPLLASGLRTESLTAVSRAEFASETMAILLATASCLDQLRLQQVANHGQEIGRRLKYLAKANQDLVDGKDFPLAATNYVTRLADYWKLPSVAWVSVTNGKSAQVIGLAGCLDVDKSSRTSFALKQATEALLASGASIGHWPQGTPNQTNEPPIRNNHENVVGQTATSLPPSGSESKTETVSEVDAETPTDRHLRNIATEMAVPAVLALPQVVNQQVVAYLFLLGPQKLHSPAWLESQRSLLESIQGQMQAAERIYQPLLHRLLNGPRQFMRRWKWWLLAGMAGILGLAALPLPYTMYCDCELATTDKRFAVAPYKGILQEVFVKPGEVVEAGALLATMDDRELRIELAGKQSAYERELNQVKASRASGETTKARITELEAKRIANEIALLQHHLAHREIRAPIAGTIVQGALLELTGAPVDVGHNLFEVASLTDLIVQIEVPEYQFRFLEIGQTVNVSLEAFPYDSFPGTLERIYPQATARENRNVFLAEIRLVNSEQKLRPGMKGQARIDGAPYPLAWKWIHYPYEKARSYLGWF